MQLLFLNIYDYELPDITKKKFTMVYILDTYVRYCYGRCFVII